MTQFLFITDLDNTLVGDDVALAHLNDCLHHHREQHGTKIVYSTGRSLFLYRELCAEKQLLPPDALVASVGTAIYYENGNETDPGWYEKLYQGWNRDRVLATVAHFSDLEPQSNTEQGEFKLSYFLSSEVAPVLLPQLKAALAEQGIAFNLIYSGSLDLDIIPRQANKGLAMRYLRQQWGFEGDRTVACGDSGNDIALFEMDDEHGIIVGNAMSELRQWYEANPSPRRYMAKNRCAGGILEGLTHFGFF
jgi:sucrose-6F-phosphate phosphohydrolase